MDLKPAENTSQPTTPRIDTSGEDPAVGATLSKAFMEMTQKQVVELGLVMQKLVEGQNSLLERLDRNDQRASDQIRELRERADKMDKATEAWEKDRAKFIEDVYNRTEKIKQTGDELEKTKAQFAEEFQKKVLEARAEIVTDNLSFDERLRNMRTVTVRSPGVLETGMEGGQNVQRLVPEVIRIKRKIWVLPPNQDVVVPEIVAQRLEEKRRSEQETDERKRVLSRQGNSIELARSWVDINKKSGSNTDAMRIP